MEMELTVVHDLGSAAAGSKASLPLLYVQAVTCVIVVVENVSELKLIPWT